MRKMTFKTTINGSVSKDALASAFKSDHRIYFWEIDHEHPDKTLIVQGEITSEEVAIKVTALGYEAHLLNEEQI